MFGRSPLSAVPISGARVVFVQADTGGARYTAGEYVGGWVEFLTRPKRKDIPEEVEEVIEAVAEEQVQETVAVQKRALKDALQQQDLRYQERYVAALREQVKYLKEVKRLQAIQDDEQDDEETLLLLM